MKLKDSKLGQWLKEKAPHVLEFVGDVLPEKGALGILKNVINRDPNISPEVKNELEIKWSDFEKEIYELELKDRADARASNVAIQESDKSSWLAKNTGYILDYTITVGFFVCLVIIIERVVPETNKEIFYMMVGILGAKWGDVVSFHRGTSRGSEDKQKAIDRMLRK